MIGFQSFLSFHFYLIPSIFGKDYRMNGLRRNILFFMTAQIIYSMPSRPTAQGRAAGMKTQQEKGLLLKSMKRKEKSDV